MIGPISILKISNNFTFYYHYLYKSWNFYRKGPNGEPICYAGRGAVQLSWNYNYGAFARWLYEIGIRDENGETLDLLNYPNMVLTKMDPPLSILGSLWFYMMPGSGIPAMHDVLIGNWAGQGQWTGMSYNLVTDKRIWNNLWPFLPK